MMDRSPLALLPEQRAAIIRRLRGQADGDSDLHLRAIRTLERRLENWWQGHLPPQTQYATKPPRILPIVLTHDPAELLIVRAIAAGDQHAEFGVTTDGSLFVTVDGHWNADSKVLFVNNLSPLLDEVTNIFHHCVRNTGGRFSEHRGRFSASAWGDPIELAGLQLPIAAAIADLGRPFALARPTGMDVLQRLRFRAESLIDGRPYASTPRTESADAARGTSEDVLVVSFDDPVDWPQVGVLGAMGYRVGRKGLEAAERRTILRTAFTVELRAESRAEREYVEKWGRPRTSARRDKIDDSLRGFISLARGQRRADKSEAIAAWESDLRWLHRPLALRLPR